MARSFPGLGPDTLVPKIEASGLASLQLGAEDGFVLSRIDGRMSVAEICLLVPFPPEQTAKIMIELARLGAIAVPGSEVASGNGLDLSREQAQRIDSFYASLTSRDAFELLEISRDVDKKEIKRAYFRLSKEFHPDRYFGKNIGPYRERLSQIFQAVKAAFELLGDDVRRTAYLESVPRK